MNLSDYQAEKQLNQQVEADYETLIKETDQMYSLAEYHAAERHKIRVDALKRDIAQQEATFAKEMGEIQVAREAAMEKVDVMRAERIAAITGMFS